MFRGIVFALSACFIWGLIFVIPKFMGGFSSMEIAVVRYWFYGSISLLVLLKSRCQGFCRYPLRVWGKAFLFSLLAGYYLWLVLAIRYTSPDVSALVMGSTPIAIALFGNWKEKEGNLSLLILPSLAIMAGLVMINAPNLMMTTTPLEYTFGLICSIVSLVSWSVYVVYNSRYLKDNPQIRNDDWASMQGIATVGWVSVAGFVWALFSWQDLDLGRYAVWDEELSGFLIGCAILGVCCSWGGGALWNKASVYLSVSVAGQMMIFETIFGVIFVYALEQKAPTLLEGAGIVLLLGAVIYGIRSISSRQPAPQEA